MNTVVATPLVRSTWKPVQLAAAIVLIAVVVFGNGIFGQFIFDDLYLLQNPRVRELWPWGSIAEATRPLASWTFQLNHALGGFRPWHFHLVNIAVHAAAVCVLFDLVRRTLLLPGILPRLREQASQLALVAAVIWMIHPLQTQSVTYISQRYEALMGLCYLLVLYCVLRGSQSSRATAWYVGAIVSAWAGAGSKEVIVTVPLVAVLFDRAYLSSNWRDVFSRRGWVYLMLVGPAVWIVYMLRTAMSDADATFGFGMDRMTAWEYLRTQPAVLLHYVRTAFWPDRLVLDHGWPVTNSPWQIYGLGAIILALFGLSAWAMWRHPRVGFLGLAAFLILAPTSSIVPVADLAFDHRMYLPLASLVLLSVLAVEWVAAKLIQSPSKRLIVLAGLTVAVCVPLALRTIQRNREYADPTIIWKQCIANNPNHPRPYRILASLYLAKEPEQALALYEQALARCKQKFWIYVDLGNLYSRQENYGDAVASFERAIEIFPKHTAPYINASRNCIKLGDFQRAVTFTRQAMEVDPASLLARQQLAWLLATSDDPAVRNGEEAVALLTDSQLRPAAGDLSHLEALSAAYAEAGDFVSAVATAEELVALARQHNSRRIVEYENRLHQFLNREPYRQKPAEPKPAGKAS